MRRLGRVGGLAGLLIFVMLFASTPITLYRMVPLARHEVAEYYVEAAKDWEAETRRRARPAGRYPGVLVDWKEVIAVDAVLRDQDFREATYSEAYQLTQEFTRERIWIERDCHTHEDGEEHCIEIEHLWYERKSMEEVMTEFGFTQEQKDWAYDLLQKAYLLLEIDIRCHYDDTQRRWECTH